MHYPRFNPTRVRLERGRRSGRRRRRAGFNPTRVRLEHVDRRLLSRPSALQPHKGASGTRQTDEVVAVVEASTPQGCVWNRRSAPARRASVRFNPTRVRLERPGTASRWPRNRSFNPTRVRLEHGDRRDLRGPRNCFNPTRVRLERAGGRRTNRGAIASTPQGCVWNPTSTPGVAEGLELQPHKGASGTRGNA